MNMLYDRMPEALRQQIYAWLSENAKDERKPSDTDDQFFYKTRKKALGPFKKAIWDMDPAAKAALVAEYDEKFAFLFDQLKIGGTTAVVRRFVEAPVLHRSGPDEGGRIIAAPDDTDLSD